MNEFEQKLHRQPLRQIPGNWRAEILEAAGNAQISSAAASISRGSWLTSFNYQLSKLLWPNQLAWGTLAIIWIFIGALQISMHDESKTAKPVALTHKVLPPSPEVIAQLQKQQRMFAELMGPHEERVADRSKVHAPRPRSQCVELLSV